MSKNKSSGSYFGSFFLVAFVVMGLLMWYLMINRLAIDSISSPDSLGMAKAGSHSHHIQSLIDQTNELLKDVINANLTLSSEVMHEISKLKMDKQFIQRDMKEVMAELKHSEDGFARCINEKYVLKTDLETCKASEEAARLALVNSGTSEEVSSSARKPDITPVTQPVVGNGDKWLVIGIPTVARPHSQEYLLTSLDAIAAQLPEDDPADLLYGRVLVLVVNMQRNTAHSDKPHTVFERAKALYAAPHPKARYFQFSDIAQSEILPDPKEGATERNDKGNANKPGYLVRRQTRNIAAVMRRSLSVPGGSRYYLFLEDDMQLCANGFLAIQYLLAKASRYHPDWLAIRASYGMNGVFLHSRDVGAFADYLCRHQARRPPDHLVVEWYAGETVESRAYKGARVNIGFKHNLFHHIGTVSTLRPQHQGAFPGCYELLAEPTVFQVEAYSPRDCPRDDVWPCKGVARPDPFLIDWSKQIQGPPSPPAAGKGHKR